MSEIATSNQASQAFGARCPAAHLLVGPDGRITGLNGAMAGLLGYERREMLGRHVLEFVEATDTGAVLAELKRGSSAAYGPAIEVAVRAKDGNSRTLLLARSTPPSRTQPTDLVRGPSVLLTGIDVTDNKTIEHLLRQQELRYMRDRHMQAIATLAGGVAAHFQHMLTTITGCAEKLREQRLKKHQSARDIEKVLAETGQAARITAGLCMFAGVRPMKLATAKIGKIVDAAVTAIASETSPAVKIVTRIEPDTPSVRADAASLRDAIIEIARNARDAMPTGGQFTISAGAAEADGINAPAAGLGSPGGKHVRLSLVDTGTGMDGETLARAFEPFFTTRDPDRFLGLGLAQVYGCVVAHHGAVNIDSVPGEGTTVTIFLPAATKPARLPRSRSDRVADA